MSDIKVLIVVDGIFNLSAPPAGAAVSTTYPLKPPTGDSPDGWFTLSFLISALRNSHSPTFLVDTASRGFSVNGGLNFPQQSDTPDPNATLQGPDPSNPTPFHFDDSSVNLLDYDVIWLFGDLGYDGGGPFGPPFTDPQSGEAGEPGRLSDSELAKITEFMQAGGGVFAVGDHDGLGAGMCGFIPRVRYMRKWFDASDTSAGLPPSATVKNWSSVYREVNGVPVIRMDTLVANPTYDKNPATGEWVTTNNAGVPAFLFDDQSDDIPQKLTVLEPSHPVVQGATGVLQVYPDHMHEGEVIVPAGAQLDGTFATDSTLTFAGPNFTEFPSPIGSPPLAPIILARGQAGATPHFTNVQPDDDVVCGGPFGPDPETCQQAQPAVLAAYDGHIVNVGRIVTDSSFHHFLDLNLLGDPCSSSDQTNVKLQGFNGSTGGKAVLNELNAFYVNIASWLAGVDRKFYFGFGKNNYGRDEVQDNLNYPAAFYLFLEGYTPNVVGSSMPTFSGSFFTDIPGLKISEPPAVTYALGHTGANANLAQRIRFEYEVQFNSGSSSSLTAFPPSGSQTPNAYTLTATLNLQGQPSVSAEFFLLGGDDPYFTNINETAGNQPYLSQDLRVFTITPTANNQTPIGPSTGANPAPQFTFQTSSGPTAFDHDAAYTYIQALITWLNQNLGYLNTDPSYTPPDTNVSDPLNIFLPQELAQNGDSSVTPNTGPNKNYNFAIARVRLKGSSGSVAAARNVNVFFRLFTTQTFDTDFVNSAAAVTNADPQVTYPSNGSLTDPSSPLPGTLNGVVNGCSLPFFATGNYDENPMDYNSGGVNNQTIEIPNGDYTWAFYGCYLNVNDETNQFDDPNHQPVQYWLAGAVHSCLVAQIAYSDAPIENENGVIENPENSDKLAQRNLQVTTSGNPGFPATHRVPQTIDVRPSPPAQSNDKAGILSYPDEIMIDWGKTPIGSVANIYWPAVSAASVVQLAAQLYPTNTLSAADTNTIKCEVVSPVTYIPIPAGAGGSFAGLLTVDLPASVRYGDEFDIVVRRITTRQVTIPTPVPPPPASRAGARSASSRRGAKAAGTAAAPAAHAADAVVENPLVWRYVTGSFLVKIQVQKESTILPGDENLLAILKWRLGLIGPGNRWYPVLLRYISYLSGRIDGMGGNASAIPPSPAGYQPPSTGPVEHAREHCYTGKVIGIRYDRFGDFEGFIMLSENGHEHWFRGREHEVEEVIRRAWIERTRISVFVESHDHHWPASIVLRQQK